MLAVMVLLAFYYGTTACCRRPPVYGKLINQPKDVC